MPLEVFLRDRLSAPVPKLHREQRRQFRCLHPERMLQQPRRIRIRDVFRGGEGNEDVHGDYPLLNPRFFPAPRSCAAVNNLVAIPGGVFAGAAY